MASITDCFSDGIVRQSKIIIGAEIHAGDFHERAALTPRFKFAQPRL